jgi:CheY-like chemotaxis protein
MQHTVLVVEDDVVQQKVLVDKLQAGGFTVISANNGEAGLEKAMSHRPDLVLLDNRMPSMSGYAMLKRLRESSSWGEKVPVIFFSNIQPSSREEQEDLESITPTAYLIKGDTSLDEILAKIRETLGA